MPLFNWEPEDSTQRVSPWLALYGGTTILMTLVIIVWFRVWAAPSEARVRRSIQSESDVDVEVTWVTKLRLLHG